jgi:hypothetical protein
MKNLKNWKSFNENVDADLKNPKFTDKNAEEFLSRLGVDITPSTGEYKPGVPEEPNVDVRKMQNSIMYGFKVEKDYENFKDFVSSKGIEYKTMDSKGARYPYHVILSK